WWSALDRLGSDPVIAAGPVLDHDRLAPQLLQPLADDTGHHVGYAARGDRHDELHRPAGIVLRRCRRRESHCSDQHDRSYQATHVTPPLAVLFWFSVLGYLALCPPVTGEPIPSGSASTRTNATRARLSLRF